MTGISIDRLHRLLQQALEVELFTLPPYLTALYSIIDGTNAPSVEIIQSVAMEEMLHAALVSNIMNAVGAEPRIVPDEHGRGPRRFDYPAQAPHISRPLVVDLLPFSKPAVETFKAIEAPDAPAPRGGSAADEFETIGELYARIRYALIAASEHYGEDKLFCHDRTRQLGAADYYGGGGELAPVSRLDEALVALDIIAQQGEGRVKLSNLAGDEVRFGQPKEVAHFYRFEEILAGRRYDRDDDVGVPTGAQIKVDWHTVRPIGEPEQKQAPEGLAAVTSDFEKSYGMLLATLEAAFNGQRSELREVAVPLMQRIKNQAIEIMRIEIGVGKTCRPPFWFVKS